VTRMYVLGKRPASRVRLDRQTQMLRQRPSRSQARYTSRASITSPEATARTTAILCHVTSRSFTSTIVHTAMNAHAPSEMMNVTTLTRINQFHGLPTLQGYDDFMCTCAPRPNFRLMYELET
jgi:hypothetical protein